MPEGSYDFYITAEGGEPYILPFEKRAETFEQFLVNR